MFSNKWFNGFALVVAITLGGNSIVYALGDSTKASGQPQPLMSSHAATQAPASGLPSEYYVIEISHRIFANFHEIDTVGMNQKFSIGEGDDEGMVILFNPHLGLTDSFKVVKVSDSLINPAVRIRVTNKDSVIQESWAFSRGGSPHFRRNDMLGFRLLNFKVGDQYFRPVPTPAAVAPKPADTTGHKK